CSECSKCFRKRSHLLEHMRLHFPVPWLACSACGRHFTSASKLRTHRLREEGQSRHACPHCSFRAVERHSLRRHCANVHGEVGDGVGSALSGQPEGFVCSLCGLGFSLSPDLKAHWKATHKGVVDDGGTGGGGGGTKMTVPFTCAELECGFVTRSRPEFARHVKVLNAICSERCPHRSCRAIFSDRAAVQQHRRERHLPFHCVSCDFACSSKLQLQRHRRAGHAGPHRLACELCPFSSHNPVELESHRTRAHAGERLHRCAECGFSTPERRILNRHALTHSVDKPHKCPECEFACRDSSYLTRHMARHRDVREHMCSECGYLTKWKSALTIHMRKHSGDLRYRCDMCPYRCHRPDQLSSHKLRHGEKGLCCEVCGYACRRRAELLRHNEAKHSGCGAAGLSPSSYCNYRTPYKQALLNHENCKHTHSRVFSCPTCPHNAFSASSLLNHRKKRHGYQPVVWDAGDFREATAPVASERAVRSGVNDVERSALPTLEPEENDREHNGVDLDGGSNSADASDVPHNSGLAVEQEMRDAAQNLVVPAVNDHNFGDAVTGRPVTTDLEGGQHEGMSGERLPVLDGTEQELVRAVDGETYGTLSNAGGVEETADSRDEKMSPPLLAVTKVTEPVDQIVPSLGKEITETEISLAFKQLPQGISSGIEEAAKIPKAGQPCDPVALQKRRDRTCVGTLVEEGKVEVVVLCEARGAGRPVLRCERCPFFTRSEKALAVHARAACVARGEAIACPECGAQFKQRRALNTHQLKRKCPAVRKQCRAASKPLRNGIGVKCEGAQMSLSWRSSQELGEVEEMLVTRKKRANIPIKPKVNDDPIRERSSHCQKEKDCKEGEGWVCDKGRFRCLHCPFLCRQQRAILSHGRKGCLRPVKRGTQQPPGVVSQHRKVTKLDNGDGGKQEGSRDSMPNVEATQGKEQDGELAVNQKDHADGNFGCEGCSFRCKQERALETHLRRGCMGPGEVQCRLCPLVCKSPVVLRNHSLSHRRAGRARSSGRAASRLTLLQCKQCPFCCKQEGALRRHVNRQHRGVLPYCCSTCEFSTKRRYRLTAHAAAVHGVPGGGPPLRPHGCDQCSRVFLEATKLRSHQRRVHDRRPTHFCIRCDYAGYGTHDVARHVEKCHSPVAAGKGSSDGFPCKSCSATFSSASALRQHLLRKHRQEPLGKDGTPPPPAAEILCASPGDPDPATHVQCTACGQEFSQHADLREHRRVQHGPHRRHGHACPTCPETFHGKQEMVLHILREHEAIDTGCTTDGMGEMCDDADEKLLRCGLCNFSCRHQVVLEHHARCHGGRKLYRCRLCTYSTRSGQKIAWHSRIHTGEKPYRCWLCEYTCTEPSRLKVHMRKHNPDTKYLCPVCGYTCKWANQLKYHMTTHTGEKPYRCEKCEYATNRSDALRTHEATRHQEGRTFVCEHCGKAFKTRYLLGSHMRKHAEVRPHVCPQCRRTFRWPAALRNHLLTHRFERPFACSLCAYQANQRAQVVSHLARRHTSEAEQGVVLDKRHVSSEMSALPLRNQSRRGPPFATRGDAP
uniref:Zinc finger protein 142 n=1 Tax=Petromyzon marinus TaxID=7757 RepID=S4RX98_PETMA